MVREGLKKAAGSAMALGLVAAAILMLGSCGGSSTPVTSVIDLKSEGVQANGELKPSVRCGWGSLWVPLEWENVPDDTKELAIYLGRFKHVKENGKRKVVVQFADLVSKFKPTERKLAANVLPEGVSWSWFGNNCVPSAPKDARVLLEVFALDHIRDRTMNRRLATRLTEEALAKPHPAEGPRSTGELTEDATAVGRLITANYTGPH
jgi:hypothetical protein